jgi:hypothetical protein
MSAAPDPTRPAGRDLVSPTLYDQATGLLAAGQSAKAHHWQQELAPLIGRQLRIHYVDPHDHHVVREGRLNGVSEARFVLKVAGGPSGGLCLWLDDICDERGVERL